jgi:hypothetical protein
MPTNLAVPLARLENRHASSSATRSLQVLYLLDPNNMQSKALILSLFLGLGSA